MYVRQHKCQNVVVCCSCSAVSFVVLLHWQCSLTAMSVKHLLAQSAAVIGGLFMLHQHKKLLWRRPATLPFAVVCSCFDHAQQSCTVHHCLRQRALVVVSYYMCAI
jgi:hypothetical protein